MGTYEGPLRIVALERLRLSPNGNPRFQVVLNDGTVTQTQSDAAINYKIENITYRDTDLMVAFAPRTRQITDLYPIFTEADAQELREMDARQSLGTLESDERRRWQILSSRRDAARRHTGE